MKAERSTGSAVLHLALSAVLGAAVFAVPLPWGGRLTVLLDAVVQGLRTSAPEAVAALCILCIGKAGHFTAFHQRVSIF